MRTAPGLRAHILVAAIAVMCALSGCAQPVREDRSIPFSADGSKVGFQHGSEGIYLASPAGGPPRKIYQPAKDMIAVSTPLWSPDGKQVIFLTATGQGQAASPFAGVGSADDPAGRFVYQGPITYTCWKYDAAAPEGARPQKLFSAPLNHPGYVAANLAVRWHPREPKLHFLAQVGANHVGLYEWDLIGATQKQIFKETAEAMIFDWSPDGMHIACVLGFQQQPSVVDGIWIGKPGSANWWHVPSSDHLARPELPSLLEMLRTTRPVFTSAGSKFAFVTSTPSATAPATVNNDIQVANIDKQAVRLLTQGPDLQHDLHWHPDGNRLGFVQGNDRMGTLHVVAENAEISAPLNERPAREFVGWNHRGDELAYITPGHVATHRDDFWSFLLVPDPLARDTVILRPAANSAATKERELLGGMRVTFPQWSPTENKLSLWLTFTPPYRSWLWIFLRYGLRPGDPAAVFDVGSNNISWLAINDYEKTQVGRYYHLTRNYQKAWEWYEQGRGAGRPAQQLMAAAGLPQANEQDFYEYLCLTRLGKNKEAASRISRFEASFVPAKGKEGAAGAPQAPLLPDMFGRIDLVRALLHDFLIAEVYLSLDLADEAEAFFQNAMREAETDEKRLSAQLALSQILLIEGKHEAYLDLCVAKLAPQYLRGLKNQAAQRQPGGLLDSIPFSALMPLATPEYLKQLSRKSVQRTLPGWRRLVADSPTSSGNSIVPFILAAALERVGEHKVSAEPRNQHLGISMPLPGLQAPSGDWDKVSKEFREQLRQFLTAF